LFIAKDKLIVGFDGADTTINSLSPKPQSANVPFRLASPCGTGKCVCLYSLKLENDNLKLQRLACEDVEHVPFTVSSLTIYAKDGDKPAVTVTPEPFLQGDSKHADYVGSHAPLLAGALADYGSVVPGQAIILKKEANGNVIARAESARQVPGAASCERPATMEGTRTRTNDEISTTQDRCVGRLASKIYSDGRCVRTFEDSTPYPWDESAVPANKRSPVYCIFQPKARDYSFSTRTSSGNKAEAPTPITLRHKDANLWFQFMHSNTVPSDAICKLDLRLEKDGVEKAYTFVTDVACGSCNHFDAPQNICFLLPLYATIDGVEYRSPQNLGSMLINMNSGGDLLLTNAHNALGNGIPFAFMLDYEARSPGDPTWSYSESQPFLYIP